jgi:hypothetical protein
MFFGEMLAERPNRFLIKYQDYVGSATYFAAEAGLHHTSVLPIPPAVRSGGKWKDAVLAP